MAETASVRFLPSGEVFDEVNEDGLMLMHLPELKEGACTYLLIAPGYKDVKGTLVADTGVMHRVDLILKKEVMSAVPSRADKVG